MEIVRWSKVCQTFVFLIVLGFIQTEQRVIQNGANEVLEHPVDNVNQSSLDWINKISSLRNPFNLRIIECISGFSIMRCMKIYVLQKMEELKPKLRAGNLTDDYLDHFYDNNGKDSLFSAQYTHLSDSELTERMVHNFQEIFTNRHIKLSLLPGILLDIIPSKDNKLSFSFKKKSRIQKSGTGRTLKMKTDEEGEDKISPDPVGEIKAPELNLIKRRKNKKEASFYKNAIVQVAVPAMVMPAILLGTILPFALPLLKFATIMTLILNNTAFLAALAYAARTHVNAQEEQHISYGSHPTYH